MSTSPPPPLPPLFETPELFEQILLLLDTKTLLLSQRVSHHWHRIITTSKPLQRKLFFLPTTTFKDILSLGFLDTTNSNVFNILDATSNKCKWLQQVVILNDIFFDTTREWKLKPVAFANPHRRSSNPLPPSSNITPSWHRMLLTQPPPSTGRGDVMFWFEDSHDNDELCQDVDTMGAMMEKVYAKEASLQGFEVHWESAAVRPVKHAVDGAYYFRLLSQRRKEEEREKEFEVVVWDGKGEQEGSDGRGGGADLSSASGSNDGFNELGFRSRTVVSSTEGEESDGL